MLWEGYEPETRFELKFLAAVSGTVKLDSLLEFWKQTEELDPSYKKVKTKIRCTLTHFLTQSCILSLQVFWCTVVPQPEMDKNNVTTLVTLR